MAFAAVTPGVLINTLFQLLGIGHEFKMSEEARKATLGELERSRLDLERLRGYGVPWVNQLARAGMQSRANVANQFARNYQSAVLGGAAPPLMRQPIDPKAFMPPVDPTLGRGGLEAHIQATRPELLVPAYKDDEAFEMRSKFLGAQPTVPSLRPARRRGRVQRPKVKKPKATRKRGE